MYSFLLSALITEKLNRENIGILEAAKQIGISYPALRSILKKPGNACHRETFEKVARWLGMTPEKILEMVTKGVYSDQVALAVHVSVPFVRQVAKTSVDLQQRLQHAKEIPAASTELLLQLFSQASPLKKAIVLAVLQLKEDAGPEQNGAAQPKADAGPQPEEITDEVEGATA